MLVYEARGIVDFVVDDEVEILLGRVLRDVGIGEFFGSHCARGRDRRWAAGKGERRREDIIYATSKEGLVEKEKKK